MTAAHVAPRVAGKLASYGAASVAELDSHLGVLYRRALTEPKAAKRATWGDIDLLLEARLVMTSKEL
jgi:hypothetical protein